MDVLRIEHPVRDYDGWKKAFDGDPAGSPACGAIAFCGRSTTPSS